MKRRKANWIKSILIGFLIMAISICELFTTIHASAEAGDAGIYDAALQSILNDRYFVIDTLVNDNYTTNPYASATFGHEDFDDWVVRDVVDEHSLYGTIAKAWDSADGAVNGSVLKTLFTEFVDIVFGDDEWDDLSACIANQKYDTLLSGVLSSEYVSEMGISSNDAYADISYLGCTEEYIKKLKEFKKSWIGFTADQLISEGKKILSQDAYEFAQIYLDTPVKIGEDYIAEVRQTLFNSEFSDKVPMLSMEFDYVSSYTRGTDLEDPWKDTFIFDEFLKQSYGNMKKVNKFLESVGSLSSRKVNLLLMLQQQGEDLTEFLERSKKYGAWGYESVADSYIRIMNGAPDVDKAAMEGALEGAASYLAGTVTKVVNKDLKAKVYSRFIRNAASKDIVTQVAVAKNVKSIMWAAGLIDASDDYIGGFKKTGEKLHEQEYLAKLKEGYKDLFRADLVKYLNCSDSSEEKNQLAKNVLFDLDMIRKVKLYSNEHALKIATYLYDETAAGLIAKLFPGKDPTECITESYQLYMNALVDIKLIGINMNYARFEDADHIYVSSNNGEIKAALYKDGKIVRMVPRFDEYVVTGIELADGQTLTVACDLTLGELRSGGNNNLYIKDGCKFSVSAVESSGNLLIDTINGSGMASVVVETYLKSGGLELQNVDLNVGTDVYVEENYYTSSGEYRGLIMENEKSSLFIGGDLTIMSYIWQSGNHASRLMAGNLEIQGNLTIDHSGVDGTNDPMVIAPDFRITFSGDTIHELHFDREVTFGIIKVEGAGFTAEEWLENYIHIRTLESDLDIYSESLFLSIDNCNGRVINGLSESKTVRIKKFPNVQKLTINGNVDHWCADSSGLEGAAVNLADNAQFIVNGHYAIYGESSEEHPALSINGGKMQVAEQLQVIGGNCSAVLMEDERGELSVGGDLTIRATDAFLNYYDMSVFDKGTLSVKGNVQIEERAAEISKDFHFILNGEEAQTVKSDCSLGRLTQNSPVLKTKKLMVYSLETDITTDGDALFLTCKECSDHSVNVNGMVFLNNLDMNGKMTVNCELARMEEDGVIPEDSEIVINGDLEIWSARCELDGTLKVSGKTKVTDGWAVDRKGVFINEKGSLISEGALSNYACSLDIAGSCYVGNYLEFYSGYYSIHDSGKLVVEKDLYFSNVSCKYTGGCMFVGGNFTAPEVEHTELVKLKDGLNVPEKWGQSVDTIAAFPFHVEKYEMVSEPVYRIVSGDIFEETEEGIRITEKGYGVVSVSVEARNPADGTITTLIGEVRLEGQTVPGAPKISVGDCVCNRIDLYWESSEDADGYYIYKQEQDGSLVYLEECSVNHTSLYTRNGLESGGTYTIVLVPYNRYGESEKATVEVTIPAHEEMPGTPIAPTAWYDAMTGGTQCWICGYGINDRQYLTREELEKVFRVQAYNVSLGGNISLNLYMDLPEEMINWNEVTAQFRVNDQPVDAEEYLVEDLYGDGKLYLGFSCGLAAAQMTEPVKMTVTYGSETFELSREFTVREYAMQLLENPGEDVSEEVLELVKAMLNYGGYVQAYLVEDPNAVISFANEGLYDPSEDPVFKVEKEQLHSICGKQEGEIPGLNYVGSSLVLESNTALRWFFEANEAFDANSLEVELDGETAELHEKDGLYYLERSDIKAGDLSTPHTLALCAQEQGEMTMTGSALSYLYETVENADESLANVCRALYLYGLAAGKAGSQG